MKAISRALLGLLVLITALPVGGSVSAQDAENTYTSVVTGSVVEWDPVDGAFIQPGYYGIRDLGNSKDEAISILTDHGRVVVNFTDYSDDPQWFIDWTLSEVPSWYSDYVDILGSDSDADFGWYLFKGTLNNYQIDYSYSEAIPWTVDGTTLAVYTYASDPASTLKLISWIQNHLTIDGERVYTTTDVPAIEAMLNGTSDIKPERVYGFTSEIADWEDQGMVSDTQWESPTWGTNVEWNEDDLYFPTHCDDTIYLDTEESTDYLILYGQDSDGMMAILIAQKHDQRADMTMQEYYEDRYTGEEWLTSNGSNYPALAATHSDTSVSVIYSKTDSLGRTSIVIRTVWEPTEDVFIVFDVINRPDLVAETYFNVIGSVTFEDQSVEALWSYEELTALLQPSNDVAEESETKDSDTRLISDDFHIWAPQD